MIEFLQAIFTCVTRANGSFIDQFIGCRPLPWPAWYMLSISDLLFWMLLFILWCCYRCSNIDNIDCYVVRDDNDAFGFPSATAELR